MTMISGVQRWRWFAKFLQAVTVLSVPFISINQRSLFRFDIPSLTLFIAGAAVEMDEFIFVLVAILFLSFFMITLTILYGRIWCGWLCPQTVVVEFTGFVDRISSQSKLYRLMGILLMLGLSLLLSASLIWYFVSPYEFIKNAIRGSLGNIVAWSWLSLTVVTFINFVFVRRRFCASVCPYAKIQGAIYDDQTMVIATDPARMDECMQCEACVKSCPVAIDIRKGNNMACVNCAVCIDACAQRMLPRERNSLIGYRFGMQDRRIPVFRRNVLIAAGMTILFLVLLLFLLFSRTMVDVSLIADSQSPPRINAGGHMTNSYVLSITNRTDRLQGMGIAVLSQTGRYTTDPDKVSIGAHEQRRVAIAVSSEQTGSHVTQPDQIDVVVTFLTDSMSRYEQKTVFYPPW